MKKLFTLIAAALMSVGASAQTEWTFVNNTSVWGSATLNGGNQYDANATAVTSGGVTFTGATDKGFVSTAKGIGFYAVGSTTDENISVIVPAGYKATVSALTSGNRTVVGVMGETTQTYDAAWASSTKDFINNGETDQTLYLYCGMNPGGAEQNKAPFLEKIVLTDMSSVKSFGWTANAVATIGGTKTTIKTYSSGESKIDEGSQFTVNVDKVIAYDGAYYVLNDDQFEANVFGKTFTMGSEEPTYEFNYELIENVAFYGEVENIYSEGQNANAQTGISVLSNGGGYSAMSSSTGYVKLAFNIAEYGKYKVILGMNNTNTRERGFNYSIDDAEVSETITVPAGNAYVQEIADQPLKPGDHTMTLNITYSLTPIFDYLLIQRTGDMNYLELEQSLPDTLKYVKGTAEDEKPNITDYIKVNTNASEGQLGAVFYVAKVEAGADKTTAEYTMYTTEEASKLAMSEAGLYYAFGRVAAMFSATEILQEFTDTIVVEVSEPVVAGHTWSFTNWSDATIANLKADAAASKISGWSDVEKKADAEADNEPTDLSKDNCFWFAGEANADGQLEANGVVIEELKGLTFPTAAYNSARSIAIAVNYGTIDTTKDFGPYEGASYFWLGGKDKDCFVIKNVKVGTEIKMGVESHKITDARGVKLMVNGTELKGTDGQAVAAPTVYADQTWVVTSGAATAKGTSLSADVADEVVDVTVHNTNGCHIYYIDAEIGEATPTAIETVTEETAKADVKKFIMNGKLVIMNGNAKFNAAGAQVK